MCLHNISNMRNLGMVPSSTAMWRICGGMNAERTASEAAAIAVVRRWVWNKVGIKPGKEGVTLDVDASVHEVHSETTNNTPKRHEGC